MQGLHLTADLRGCAAHSSALLLAPEALRGLCLAAVDRAGLSPVGELFHRFSPAPGESQSGVTGVVLLAESHLAVHTWPEMGGVTLDVYVCNLGQDNSARAEVLMEVLIAAFAPEQALRQRLMRGGDSAS